jgi:hypothetical protein
MAQLRYNLTSHAATGITPYRAIFGSNAFKFDCCLLARFWTDDEPDDLAARLKEVHAQLLERGVKSRDRAARAYDRAVDEVEFAAGERVLVWDDASALALGRKLRTHWLGPYEVEEKLSPVSYILRAEGDERVARVHVNRMRRWTSRAEENVRDPSAGMWPDSRRVLRSIMGRRERNGCVEFQVPRAGRRVSVWVPQADLPEVVVRAYDLLAKERAQL